MNHNKKKKWLKYLFIIIPIILILSTCPNPPDNGPPEPPSSVTGSLSGDCIQVSWPNVESAKRYQLYRKIGDGVFIETGSLLSVNQYIDELFPPDKAIQYAVKSESDGVYSVMSRSSNPVSENVLNVKVSRYEYTNTVRLQWAAIEDPLLESYRIYRFLSRAQGAMPERSIEVTDNFLYDTTISPGVPYFYGITWKKEGLEYGMDALLVFGISGDETDGYEPNDDYYVLTTEETTQFFDWDTTDWSRAPFAYSYEDGAGGAESDTDYYKYKGPPVTLFVRVKLLTLFCFFCFLSYTNLYITQQILN